MSGIIKENNMLNKFLHNPGSVNRYLWALLFLIGALAVASATPPTLTSPTKTAIFQQTATLGASITSNGGATITDAGVVYGLLADPDITGNVMTSSATSGAFTVPVTGLTQNTLYHFRGYATNSAGTSYTTDTTFNTAAGPLPVDLGTAGSYEILSKAGISTVPASQVTGNIAVSPIAQGGMTGWSETLDLPGGTFSTSSQVTGKLFAADYAVPTPGILTVAIGDMETAYNDAAGRITPPPTTELGLGEIGGLNISPGLYKWSSGITITTDVTLTGGPNDVWIFQIAGDITQASSTKVTLAGGARPSNIFWQTFGAVNIGVGAHFEGIIICKTAITLYTGASINGRLLAQTRIDLQKATVRPAPPLTAVALTPSLASPRPTGTAITLTATPTDGANVVYQFLADTTVIRDYSASSTCTWTPTAAKTYSLTVNAKDLIGADPTAVVTSPAAPYVIFTPLTAVTLAGVPTSPVVVNTPVTLTATPNGGNNVEYRFQMVYTPTGGIKTTTLLRDWMPGANTCLWTPVNAGKYALQVLARETGAVTYLYYTLTFNVTTPLSKVTLMVTPTGPISVAMPVNLVATPTGGTNVQYRFQVVYTPSGGTKTTVLATCGAT
jgi:hypothetical protein